MITKLGILDQYLPAAFLSPLRAELVDDTANQGAGSWKLFEPLIFRSKAANCIIMAEMGFVTDFGSVPRLPLIYLAHGNKAHRPCAIHDYCYTHQLFSRQICDAILREAIIAVGYDQETARDFYLGVRAGGASHFGV